MPDELQRASYGELFVGIVLASLLVGLLVGVAVKFVAQSVLKHPVRYFDAFKAAFAATIVQAAIFMALLVSGTLTQEAISGIALQVVGLFFGVVVLALTISIFIRAPDGKRPEFAQAGVAAAIVQVVLLVLQIAISALGLPMSGQS